MCLPLIAPLLGGTSLATVGGTLLGTGATSGALATTVGAMSTFGPLAQGLLTFGAQSAQASAQAEMQRRAADAERARYAQESAAMRRQQAAEAMQSAQKVAEANRASMEAMARKQVAAGEAGVSLESASYLAEMRDLERQTAEYNYAVMQSDYLSSQAYEMRARDLGLASQQNLININRPISRPDFLSTAFDITSQTIQNQKELLKLDPNLFSPRTQSPYN